MRVIDERAIKAHADLRFRSEYDYALFEYYRSAKVIAFLDRAGVAVGGRILDAGCGGGGMPLSLAEEAGAVVGIDPINRFADAGIRLARDRGLANVHFAMADGMALPFRNGAFDLVLSHAVIEHVSDALLYLRECARVLAPGDPERSLLWLRMNKLGRGRMPHVASSVIDPAGVRLVRAWIEQLPPMETD